MQSIETILVTFSGNCWLDGKIIALVRYANSVASKKLYK